MKNYPTYSITIRTLGKAGDKYAATLESIRKQTLKPEEVVIVIPDGYDLPKDRLGFERFVRCKKGMVNQRVVGINEMSSDFTLALDDDVEFNADFVKSLFDIQINNSADFVSPKITEPNNSMTTSKPVSTQQPSSARGGGISLLLNALQYAIGIHYTNTINNGYAVKIASTGGFISKTIIEDNNIYPTQSGHGTVCFGKTKALKNLNFKDELWLEEASYPLPEDQVMFYKLFLMGNKLLYAPQIEMVHLLDAGTSINSERKLKNTYASARNGLIFWHRFIYKVRPDKINVTMAISRRIIFTLLISALKGFKNRNFAQFKTQMKGYNDARKYVRSEFYKSLPKI